MTNHEILIIKLFDQLGIYVIAECHIDDKMADNIYTYIYIYIYICYKLHVRLTICPS